MTESENKICNQLINACFHEAFDIDDILKDGETSTLMHLENYWYWEQDDIEDVFLVVLSGEKIDVPFPEYNPMGMSHKCVKLLDDDKVVMDYAKLEEIYKIGVYYSPTRQSYCIFWNRKIIAWHLDCPPHVGKCVESFIREVMGINPHAAYGKKYIKTIQNTENSVFDTIST